MNKFGKIVWQDLTIEDAANIKDFYCEVIGWKASDVDQGGYNDFNITLNNGNEEVVAGICHKRGEIKNFPSQWLMYVTVENINTCVEKCTTLGGKVIEGPKPMGKAQFAIIQDPAGAYLALLEE